MKKSYKSIGIICENLSNLYKDGIDMSMAITLLEDIPMELFYKNSVKAIGMYILKGESIQEAFSHFKNLYPDFFLGALALGENSGEIDKVLKALGNYYKKQYEIKKRIRDSLFYPAFILFTLVLLMLGLTFFVLPIFYESLNSLVKEIPKGIKEMYLFQQYIKEHPFVSVSFIFSFFLSFFIIFQMLRKKLNIFNKIIGIKLVKEIVEYIFILILSIIVESGLALTSGLDLCISSLESSILKRDLERIYIDILEGKELNESLKECKFISNYSMIMIKLGEDSGSIEERLLLLSKTLEKNIYRNIEKALMLFQPAMILLMAIIVTSFIGYFLFPLMDILYKVG